MPGSIKFTIPTGARFWFFTVPLSTLNAQTAFTVSGWFEIASLGSEFTNCDLFGAVTSYPFTVGIQNNAQLQLFAESSGGAKSISYQPLIDAKGHFVVISYSAAGTTTIYVDGAPARTIANIGTTAAVDQVLNFGFNAVGAAVTLYLKDVAIWAAVSLGQQSVIDLRDGTFDPANLMVGSTPTPATNRWTLQGIPGTATVSDQGLIDTLGGVNLSLVSSTGGTATYDTHEIVLSFAARMMTPYCDVTGTLIFIPLYADPLTTTGGPASPTSVNLAPVFKLNGVTMDGLSGRPAAPTQLAINPLFYVLVYQMPSGTSAAPDDVLTMAAPMGWASTNVGLVAGTSGSGLGSLPLTVTNYAGQTTEFPAMKTLKVGYNVPSYAPSPFSAGQPRANYASRLWEGNPLVFGGWTGGTVLTYDPTTQLPLTISGQARGIIDNGTANGLESPDLGTPAIEGVWTLVYGDASTGVGSGSPNQTLGLQFNASWTVTTNPHGLDSAGSWNGSAWTGIRKTYRGVYSGSGARGSGLSVLIDSGNGNVGFPSKGNGQVELGIFPPSQADREVSSPDNWDPLGIDPEYLLKHQGAHCLRWMAAAAGTTNVGGSSMITVGDLAQRQVNDFLWTKQSTVTCNVISAGPIGATFDAIMNYQGTTQTMSASNWHDSSNYVRVPILIGVDPLTPHGMRTGDTFSIAGTTAAPAVVIKQDNLLLAAAITVTTSPITFTVNTTSPPMAIGDTVLIDSEVMTVTGSTGNSVTCSRTAGALHAIGAPVYTNFTTASMSSGTTTIPLSRTTGLTAHIILQVDSEQMLVTSVGTLSATVTRGVNGTSAATHASGSLVYPCLQIACTTTPGFVVSDTEFVIGLSCTYLPFSGDVQITNPTLKDVTNYTAPNIPVYTLTKPSNNGSAPYEFAANTTNTVAVAKGSRTILWINVGLLATDDLVTETIANHVIPFIGSLVDLIIEVSNEIWQGGNTDGVLASVLYPTAPNPEGPAYRSFGEFVASRQHYVNGLAKAAFTAAGLDPGRVYNFQPGHRQIGFAQAGQNATVAYCQANGIPIDYLSLDGYVDITADVWDVFWDFMPAADGGSASWSRATARRVMMSYFRAWCWFSAYFGTAILGSGQVLSWYKAGKSVVNSGVGTATANTGLGRLCYYESATEFLTDPSTFVNPRGMMRDLIYDGIPQWTGDTGWKATEEAYYAAKQGAGAMYAALMPSAGFPDLPSATPAFSCPYSSIFTYGSEGEAWLVYNWQGQQPGTGISNVMGWSVTAPVAQDRLNQSIRGQVALDWIASSAMSSVGTATTIERGDILTAVAIAGVFGLDTVGSAGLTERRDILAGIELSAHTHIAVAGLGDIMVGIGEWSPDSDSGLVHPDLVSLASYTIDPREVTEV